MVVVTTASRRLEEEPQQVAAERRQQRQHRIGDRGEDSEAAGERWNQSHRRELPFQIWEQHSDACPAHPTHIRVGGALVTEVVPKQPASRAHHPPNLRSDVGSHSRIQDRAEDCVGHDEVEASVRKWKVLGIAHMERDVWEGTLRGLNPFRQEVDADKMRFGGSQFAKPCELCAAARTDVEDAAIAHRQPARALQQLPDQAAALGQYALVAGVAKVPAHRGALVTFPIRARDSVRLGHLRS
jgi:hypothetical protein